MAALGSADAEAQSAFSAAVAALLRESRIRQGMTQAQVSARTGGLVSKAALANYETGHRSVRVDVFWLLVRALGEDAGAMLASAERRSGYGRNADTMTALTIDIAAVQASADPRLAPVQRWFALRLQPGPGRPAVRTVTLDDGALAALSSLMGVSPEECRALLVTASAEGSGGEGAGDVGEGPAGSGSAGSGSAGSGSAGSGSGGSGSAGSGSAGGSGAAAVDDSASRGGGPGLSAGAPGADAGDPGTGAEPGSGAQRGGFMIAGGGTREAGGPMATSGIDVPNRLVDAAPFHGVGVACPAS